MITAFLSKISKPHIFAAVIGLSVLLAGPGTAQVTPVGGIARNFTVTNRANNQPINLTDFAGKILVLDFFAYWCGPCQSSSPDVETNIQKYYAARGGNAFGVPVQVLAASIDASNPSQTNAFVAAAGLELVADDNGGSAGAWSQFNEVNGIPLFVILNCVAGSPSHAQWKVLYKQAGYAGAVTLRSSIDTVQAAATPEIAVEQPAGTNIADAGAKAFGSVNVGSNTSLTFTIRNTGTANLTGLAITKDGTNPADFTLTSSPVAPVAGPNGTTTFTVQFAPGAVGPRSAVIHIANNDGNENPFDITLTGTGIAPEIAVEQPVGTNIADAGAKAFGSVNVGSNTSLTFTIKNTGTANLTGLAITKDGTNPADFTLTSSPAAPVAGPNGTTTFTVQFAPGAVGPRSAVIHIASNDGDENPFDITLTGTGIAPEIAVEQPAGTNIADGGAKDFDSVNIGSNTSLSFTIKNIGTGTLTGLVITKDGTNPADFTVTSSPAPVIGPNVTTTFNVQFTPGTVGPRSAVIRIANNDGDENPFDITLTGTGIAPEISVEQPLGTNIADGGAKDFGSVNVGSNTSLSFTIKNTGTADLTGLTITKDGTNPADFTLTSSPVAPVAGPNGTTTFIVQFAPGAVGPRSAIIRIANNDGNENPFDITLTGTGIAPEIAVEQPAGTNIADGGAKDFGSVNVGSNTSLSFTIKNTGTADLTGLAITKDGTNPADFTLTSSPVAPVAGPNGTTTFIVQFAPGAVGPRSAVIHIASNDGDENPFDITLTGTGMFFDDFDPAQTPALWAQFGGSVEANSNGQAAGSGSTGNSLWFGGDGSRYATTQPMDTRTGGGVSFLFAIANGTFSPWESADDGEDVVLEYANDGTNFVQIGGPYNNRAWQKHVLAIPAPARTMATRFRFRQLSNSAAAYDHWAIDDVQIGSSVVIAPEIAVEQPAGTGLTDGSSTVNFHLEGNDLNCSRTLVIRNVGTTDLTINEVTRDGTNAADFTLGSPGAGSLAPGAATTLTITFRPGGVGARSAVIRIASNDGDENPFDINLTGTGLLTAIQSWRQTYFGTTSNTGNSEDTADPYHTGIPNLLVFAFAGPNQNPVSAKVSQLPQIQQSGGSLFYSFTQPAGVSGVTYGAEWSQTLLSGSWTAVSDTGTFPQHTFSVPIGTNAKLFMRLKVTNP